jgi:hypothetical protein
MGFTKKASHALNLLTEYQKEKGNSYLFGGNGDESNGTRLMKDTFKTICGKELSCNLLKKIYISKRTTEGTLKWASERLELSRQMGNSVILQQTVYMKKNRHWDLGSSSSSKYECGDNIDKSEYNEKMNNGESSRENAIEKEKNVTSENDTETMDIEGNDDSESSEETISAELQESNKNKGKKRVSDSNSELRKRRKGSTMTNEQHEIIRNAIEEWKETETYKVALDKGEIPQFSWTGLRAKHKELSEIKEGTLQSYGRHIMKNG